MEGKKSPIDDLAKLINANSGHLRIVLDQWYKEGVINKEKTGRDYAITLTDKGSKIAVKLAEMMELVDRYKLKNPDTVMSATSDGTITRIETTEARTNRGKPNASK